MLVGWLFGWIDRMGVQLLLAFLTLLKDIKNWQRSLEAASLYIIQFAAETWMGLHSRFIVVSVHDCFWLKGLVKVGVQSSSALLANFFRNLHQVLKMRLQSPLDLFQKHISELLKLIFIHIVHFTKYL